MLTKSIVVLVAFVGIQPLYAAEFFCPSGDVTCLIAAINEANLSEGPHTIFLEPGTYTLTTVDNVTDGPNGLPSIRTNVTIRQDDWQATIERDPAAPDFRLFHVGSAFSARLTLYGLGLRNGRAADGTAVFTRRPAILERLSIYSNVATDPQGGTVSNWSMQVVRIIDTGVASNTGTGVIAGGLNAMSLVRSLIFRNSAHGVNGRGNIIDSAIYENGEIGVKGGHPLDGYFAITNSTIARNQTGITSWNRVTNSTISENQLGVSGNRLVHSELRNTIIAGNAQDCTVMNSQFEGRNIGHNIVGNLTGCELLNQQPTDIVGDPGLGEWQFFYYPLLSDSPAIDSANPDACPEFDQLGNPRVGVCDRGAIEFQGE